MSNVPKINRGTWCIFTLIVISILYGGLLLVVWLLYAGLLPGADAVLGGRHIHPLAHYVRYFSLLFIRGLGWIFVVAAFMWFLTWWARRTGGWKKFLPRFAFLLLFTALLAEIVLRIAFALPGGRIPRLQNPSLLGEPGTDDFHWVLIARLSGKVARDYVIPELGWGQEPPTEENPLGLSEEARRALHGAGAPIYFFGDSFVQGMEYNKKTLSQMVSEKSGRTVINFGVRGYGVDQMYLKARQLGLPPAGGEVWVGILTWDLDRTYLEYSYGQKPRFQLVNDTLELPNIPITKNNEDYVRAYRMPFRSWLMQAFRRYRQAREGLEAGGPAKEEKIALNRAILRDWSAWCREAGVPLRVVLFHSPYDLQSESWRNEAVKSYCREFDLPLFDTAGVLLPYLEKNGRMDGDIYAAGDFHHTDLANDMISGWLAGHWISAKTEQSMP